MSSLLEQSQEFIADDDNFVRLTIGTTLIHSIIVILITLNSMNTILNNWNGGGIEMSKILGIAQKIYIDSGMTGFFLILTVILVIGYFLLYPIGVAAMIHYLEDGDKSVFFAISKGAGSFFPMFEYILLNGIGFTLLSYTFMFARAYVAGILFNPMVVTIMVMWFIVIFGIMILWPYTQFAIVLEGKPVMEAIGTSMSLFAKNPVITFQYVIIGQLLQLRFLLNMIFIVGIPLVIIFIAMKFNIVNEKILTPIIYVTFVCLTCFAGYLNGIVEAYFMTYWYKLYKQVS